MKANKNFNMRDFIKTVITLAMPIALQNLLSTTASMVDTIMIGSRGELSVAAVGICSQISSLFFALYYGVANGTLLYFSQFYGSGDERGINRTFGLGGLSMLIISLCYGAIAVIKPGFLLSVYTDKVSIIAEGLPYIRIVGFAYPLQVIAVIISYMMRSTQRVKYPLIASILSLVTNFLLNWVLIYGRFGFPQMGVTGAAVGTLASAVVNVIVLLIFLARDKAGIKLHLNQLFNWQGGFAGSFYKKCFPMICNEVLYGVGQMLINIVVGRQSEPAIAAMAAFRVLEGFVFAFFGGLSDAASVVVGKEIGSGHHMEGYTYVKRFAALCPMITLCICLILYGASGPVLGLFGLEAEALYYGKRMLLIYVAAGTIRTCNYIMNNCYRAAGETVFGTVVELTCLFTVSVPATFITGMVLKLPFLFVFAFVYLDEPIRLVLELRYTLSGKWVKPVTEAGKATLAEFKEELLCKGTVQRLCEKS